MDDSDSRRKGGKFAKGNKIANPLSRTSTARDTPSVSPIHALAPEILVAIFAQALLEQVEFDYRSSWNRMVPMNISAACHQWRTIVLASSILWSTIRIFDRPVVSPTYSPRKHFDLFLRRSRQAPLDITIDSWMFPRADCELLLSALYDNQTRLRKVDIGLGLFFGDSQTDRTLSNLSIVEDLRVTCGFGKMPIPLKLKHAPSLKCLKLGERISIDADLILPNLVNIDLSYGSPSYSFSVLDCIMLLQASPSIEEFRAHWITIFADDHHHSNPEPDSISTCLPRLSFLRIQQISSEALRLMLRAMTLPGLKKLEIRVFNSEFGDVSSTCGVNSFLERSNAMLEILDLCIPDASEIKQCLESKSSLELQTLYLSEDTSLFIETRDTLLRHLTPDSSVRMCPRLKKIVFNDFGLRWIEDYAVNMIHSWWSRSEMDEGSSLEAVEFLNCSERRVRDIAPQLEERCEGLDIIINNNKPRPIDPWDLP